MAHDVYISHARKDQKIAEAICQKLDGAEVRCYIAPRDISPGGDWMEATRKAIRSSRAMVLVFSENANAAPHIEREIAHAFYTGRAIIPLRLGKTLPRRDFLFYLGDVPWFDAFGPHPEQQLEALTSHIKALLLGPAVTSNPLRSHSANKRTAALNSLNPGKYEVRTSNHRIKQIFKRVAIAASVFAVVWLLWLASSQIRHGASLEQSNFGSISSGRSTSLDLPPHARGDASAPTPRYAFTRLGLWVPVKASPTPLVQAGPQDTSSAMSLTPSASATPSRPSNTDQNAINPNQAAVPVPTPSVAASVESTPLGAQARTSFKASPEEQSLKEFVLDYIRTVESNYVPTQERFFAQQVNFYGKGVLSRPMVEASMEEYRREWPIRNWEPRGEPEFPKSLHSTDPELYEVLQPLAWTLSNGSRHKQGNTTLYVRIRKNDKGEFRIIQVQQRDPQRSVSE
jgi:TIR domain